MLHTTTNVLEREQKSLESEASLDASRGVFTYHKYGKLSDLEERIQDTQERIAEKFEEQRDATLEVKSVKDTAEEKRKDTEFDIHK